MEGVTDTVDIPPEKEREAWVAAQAAFRKPVFNRTDPEMSRILTLVSRLPIMQGLSFEQRFAMSKLVRFRRAEPGEVLLQVPGGPEEPAVTVTRRPHTVDDAPDESTLFGGTSGAGVSGVDDRTFFIVIHGCVKQTLYTVNGRVFSELFKGATFGSPLVLDSVPAGTAYSAAEPTELLTLPVAKYEQHLGFLDERELARRVEFFKKLTVPVLANWKDAQFAALARAVYPIHYPSRTVSVREGEKADSVFFIVDGKMKVVREIDFTAAYGEPCAKLLELATLAAGEYYGELALLRVHVDGNRRVKPRKLDVGEDTKFDESTSEEDELELKALSDEKKPIARQATVYAHTPADVLVLPSEKYIQLFTESALIRSQEYAKGYPTQAEIRRHFLKQQEWANFKDAVMTQVVAGTGNGITVPSTTKAKKAAAAA